MSSYCLWSFCTKGYQIKSIVQLYLNRKLPLFCCLGSLHFNLSLFMGGELTRITFWQLVRIYSTVRLQPTLQIPYQSNFPHQYLWWMYSSSASQCICSFNLKPRIRSVLTVGPVVVMFYITLQRWLTTCFPFCKVERKDKLYTKEATCNCHHTNWILGLK